MFGQLRVKPDVLKAAMSKQRAGQHLFAPSRDVPPGWPTTPPAKLRGSDALACGGLGGFAGFLHKEFRIHDYFLGRMNCRKFLREHFTLTAEQVTANPIFSAGYGGDPGHARWNQLRTAEGKLPIIPVFEQAADYLPTFSSGSSWPVRRPADIDRYEEAIKERGVRVLLLLLKKEGFAAWFFGLLIRVFGFRKKLGEALVGVIKDQLRLQALLPGKPKERDRNNAPCPSPPPLRLKALRLNA